MEGYTRLCESCKLFTEAPKDTCKFCGEKLY